MEVRFDTYYDNEELDSILNELAKNFPELLSLSSIGKSHEGRDIWVATITDESTGPDTDKPAYYIDGNLHASEVTGAMTCLYAIHALVTRFGSDETVTRLVKRIAFYIVPRVNPDGADRFFRQPRKIVRSGVRSYPKEEEGDGLYPEDVDGDGLIVDMRVPDPTGNWRISDKDPRLMVKRGPDEEGGTYYRVFTEGRIRNFDGHLINLARPLEGLDFNRNFPSNWEGEGEQKGAGPYPVSEPEVRAIVQFVTDHPNICQAINYHTAGGAHLRPFGFAPDSQMPPEDLKVYELLGKIATERTGYPAVSPYHDFGLTDKTALHGSFFDWLYDRLGVFAWSPELWDRAGLAGIKDRESLQEWFWDHPEEDDLTILEWIDDNLGDEGFVSWHPFDHPELGRVEIGGWDDQLILYNPPPKFLEREASKHFEVTLSHAACCPWLQVRHLSCEPTKDDLHKV
ncbi:MAG: M14 family metallopeptidase, partial [Actinomycetota bacterium]